jgi:transcriptional regulator with XRE-family HTH domain
VIAPRTDNRFARLLLERGLSQSDIAAVTGVSRQTIGNAYHGRDNISLESWCRLARALGVPVAAIAPPSEAARLIGVA